MYPTHNDSHGNMNIRNQINQANYNVNQYNMPNTINRPVVHLDYRQPEMTSYPRRMINIYNSLDKSKRDYSKNTQYPLNNNNNNFQMQPIMNMKQGNSFQMRLDNMKYIDSLQPQHMHMGPNQQSPYIAPYYGQQFNNNSSVIGHDFNMNTPLLQKQHISPVPYKSTPKFRMPISSSDAPSYLNPIRMVLPDDNNVASRFPPYCFSDDSYLKKKETHYPSSNTMLPHMIGNQLSPSNFSNLPLSNLDSQNDNQILYPISPQVSRPLNFVELTPKHSMTYNMSNFMLKKAHTGDNTNNSIINAKYSPIQYMPVNNSAVTKSLPPNVSSTPPLVDREYSSPSLLKSSASPSSFTEIVNKSQPTKTPYDYFSPLLTPAQPYQDTKLKMSIEPSIAFSLSSTVDTLSNDKDYLYTECSLKGLANADKVTDIIDKLVTVLTGVTGKQPILGLWKIECWRPMMSKDDFSALYNVNTYFEKYLDTNPCKLDQSYNNFSGDLWLQRYLEPSHLKNLYCLRMYSPEHLVAPANFPVNARRVKECTVTPQFIRFLPSLGFRRTATNDFYVSTLLFQYNTRSPDGFLLIYIQKHFKDEQLSNDLFPGKYLVQIIGRTQDDLGIENLSRHVLNVCNYLQPLVQFNKV